MPWSLTARTGLAVTVVTVVTVVVGLVGLVGCGPSPRSTDDVVIISDDACASRWSPPAAGQVAITVRNRASQGSTIALIGSNQEREMFDPQPVATGATEQLHFGLNPGTYAWRCTVGEATHRTSDLFVVAGSAPVGFDPIDPPSAADLTDARDAYSRSVVAGLALLGRDTDTMAADIDRGDVTGARRSWLVAHLDYVRLGAAYGTFADADARIDGRDKSPAGAAGDPAFTGFHRVEAMLWSPTGSVDDAATAAHQLQHDVRDLITVFPNEITPPGDLALRAHEILENGMQDELTGSDDDGSHSELATLRAQIDATRVVLAALDPVLRAHQDGLRDQASSGLDALASFIDGLRTSDGSLPPIDQLDAVTRHRLDGLTAGLLEVLARIPIALKPAGEGNGD